MDMRATMLMPSQNAEKLPATRPDRMLSDAPPSSVDVTTSRTCRDSVDVNTFTSSGMTAPASVPHEMMVASFHQSVGLPPSSGMIALETMNVRTMEMIEVSHTSDVSGASKFMTAAAAYRALATASLMKYEPALDTSIMMRMTKIQTSSCTCTIGSCTPSRMNVISATPVTP